MKKRRCHRKEKSRRPDRVEMRIRVRSRATEKQKRKSSQKISQALSVGIFPYVLKLLQSAAADLRQILIFIWAKILALDKACQLDLVKDNGHRYFIGVSFSLL